MSTEGIEQADFGEAERTVSDVWEAFPREDYELLWERLDVLRPSQREEAALAVLIATDTQANVSLEEVLGWAQTMDATRARARAAYLMRENLGVSTVELGTIFDRSHSSIQRAMEAYQVPTSDLAALQWQFESYPRLAGKKASGEPSEALTEKVGELVALAEETEFLEELRPMLVRIAYPYHKDVDELLAALERLKAIAAETYRIGESLAGLDRRRAVAMAADREVERMREEGVLTRPRGKVRKIPTSHD